MVVEEELKIDTDDRNRQRIVICQDLLNQSLEYKKSTPEDLSACSENSSDLASKYVSEKIHRGVKEKQKRSTPRSPQHRSNFRGIDLYMKRIEEGETPRLKVRQYPKL